MIITSNFGTSALVDYAIIMFKCGDIFHMKRCIELNPYISNFSYNFTNFTSFTSIGIFISSNVFASCYSFCYKVVYPK